VPFLEFPDWQGTAVAAQIVEPSDRVAPVTIADGMIGHAAFAVLQVLRADFGHQPTLAANGACRGPCIGHFHLGQGRLGRFLVFFTADALATVVKKRHPLLRAR
jgi:hypothetical protein